MNEYQGTICYPSVGLHVQHRLQKRIAILGYAFKKDTNDTRESPAIGICGQLLEEKQTLPFMTPGDRASILSTLG